jgi:hypothetical protein
MRIEAVQPITALSSDQADMLQELLRDKPELAQSDLVLYRLREGGSSVDMVAQPHRSSQSGTQSFPPAG